MRVMQCLTRIQKKSIALHFDKSDELSMNADWITWFTALHSPFCVVRLDNFDPTRVHVCISLVLIFIINGTFCYILSVREDRIDRK